MLALALAAMAACGGVPPAPQAPTTSQPPQPTASATPPPPPDLSAVPDPQSLVAAVRLAKPGASLSLAKVWSRLPVPGADRVTELMTSDALGPLVDLDQPIDLAVALAGGDAIPRPVVAASAAIKNPDRARATLAERYKLVPGPNGATLIHGLGQAHDSSDDSGGGFGDDTERSCELAPAFGSAPVRLVCGLNAQSLAELTPWLTRTATRAAPGADLHADLHLAPLRPFVARQRRLLPLALGTVLGSQSLGKAPVRELLTSAVGEAVDFVTDIDSTALDLTLADTGARASATLAMASTTSVFARLAVSHPERSGPVPPIFWQLPGDADAGGFHRGIDDADVALVRELLLQATSAGFAAIGIKDADRKAVLDAVTKMPVLAPTAYASGIDAAAVRKAMDACHALGGHGERAERLEARRAAIDALRGWRIAVLHDPAGQMPGAMRDLVAALGRPGIAAALRAQSKDAQPPLSLRGEPMPKDAGLPAGSVMYRLEISDGPAADDARPADNKRPPAVAKPSVTHVAIVPDGPRTWVGLGSDASLVVAKLAVSLGATGSKLSGRSDLEALRTESVGAGGFFSNRGLSEMFALGALNEGALGSASAAYERAARVPDQGASAIVFSVRAQASGGRPAAVATLQVPAAAVEGLVGAVAGGL
jgi:hypothetical protein